MNLFYLIISDELSVQVLTDALFKTRKNNNNYLLSALMDLLSRMMEKIYYHIIF